MNDPTDPKNASQREPEPSALPTDEHRRDWRTGWRLEGRDAALEWRMEGRFPRGRIPIVGGGA